MAPTYEFRQAGFIGRRLVCCHLEHGDLTIQLEGKQLVSIPYQDITEVSLSSRAHGRNEAVLQVRDFRCQVTARRQVVEITNRSDPGVGRPYEYQNHSFNSFVYELHRRLEPFQDRVHFRSGRQLYYRLTLAADAVFAVVGPFRLDSYGSHLAFGIAVYLSVVAGLLVAARRLRPRLYAPMSIPAELLPPEKNHRGIMA
jgi:hypothetical protein